MKNDRRHPDREREVDRDVEDDQDGAVPIRFHFCAYT
jgi:hypothetical protein